jgi:hypothetical protein|tara:strand:- start:3 stop:161 length:159 start_codon:yes stop_codon:yes gene_type:complete
VTKAARKISLVGGSLADLPAEETMFRGVIGANFLIGTTAGGRDIVMLHLKKR